MVNSVIIDVTTKILLLVYYTGLHSICHVPYMILYLFYMSFCNSYICMYTYIYVCVCMYIYIYLICIYLYFTSYC